MIFTYGDRVRRKSVPVPDRWWLLCSLHCRPSFKELTPQVQVLLDLVKEDEARKAAATSSSSKGGLLSKLNLRAKDASSKDSKG